MSDDDTFGFGDAKKPAPPSLSEKLSIVQPKAAIAETVSMDAIDEVAERRGFRSRETTPPRALATTPVVTDATRRRKGAEGPFVAINTRAPVRVAEPFIAWCERERYSYWQGIEELMRRAGLS